MAVRLARKKGRPSSETRGKWRARRLNKMARRAFSRAGHRWEDLRCLLGQAEVAEKHVDSERQLIAIDVHVRVAGRDDVVVRPKLKGLITPIVMPILETERDLIADGVFRTTTSRPTSQDG
jgi:hypothetical protein